MTSAAVDLILHDVTVTYARVPALHHLSGVIAAGSLTAITGPNGGGKSTLLKAIMGFVGLAEGRIDRGGLRPRDLGYLPQAHDIDRTFPITVADLAALGAWREVGAFGALTVEHQERVRSALTSVGLDALAHATIQTLSAGQFQRALFARLLVGAPGVILLDEPFAGVDEVTVAALLAIIHRWHDEGRTVLAVLHDHQQIQAHFPATMLLARECVAWGPTAGVLTPDNLARAAALTRMWAHEAARGHHPLERAS